MKRRMQPKKSRRGRSKGSKATNPAVELRVRVEDAAFVMLHHPLEVAPPSRCQHTTLMHPCRAWLHWKHWNPTLAMKFRPTYTRFI